MRVLLLALFTVVFMLCLRACGWVLCVLQYGMLRSSSVVVILFRRVVRMCGVGIVSDADMVPRNPALAVCPRYVV